jgi:hypothetical protein
MKKKVIAFLLLVTIMIQIFNVADNSIVNAQENVDYQTLIYNYYECIQNFRKIITTTIIMLDVITTLISFLTCLLQYSLQLTNFIFAKFIRPDKRTHHHVNRALKHSVNQTLCL